MERKLLGSQGDSSQVATAGNARWPRPQACLKWRTAADHGDARLPVLLEEPLHGSRISTQECRLDDVRAGALGNWHTIYRRMKRWAKADVLDKRADVLRVSTANRVPLPVSAPSIVVQRWHPPARLARYGHESELHQAAAQNATPAA